MRIIHLVHDKDFQNLETILIPFLKNLKASDVYCSMLVITETDVHVPRLIKDGVDVTYVRKKKGMDFGLIGVLRHLITDQKADIVHAHNSDIIFYGGLAALFSGKPILLTQHKKVEKKLPAFLKKLNRFVVFSSQYIKDDCLKDNPIDKSKLKIIYNGFPTLRDIARQQENNLKWRKELGIQEDSFVIGNVGNFIKEEDQSSIIKSFRKAFQRKLNSDVVICGRGPLKENLVGLTVRYGFQERVKIIDVPQKLDELFDMFNCFVLSCSIEGRSSLILKAMQAGKPVIVTNIGEYPEFVDEGKSGMVVPCGFPERIDSAIMRLNAIPGLAEKFGQVGRERLEIIFNFSAMTKSYKVLYEAILPHH